MIRRHPFLATAAVSLALFAASLAAGNYRAARCARGEPCGVCGRRS